MMRWALALAAVLVLPAVGIAQTPVEPPADRMEDFVNAALLTPGPYALAFGGALIDEVSNFPEEWTGTKGFGQRVLGRVGMGFASDALGHGLAAVLHHRVRYEPCSCAGPWRRTRHALSRGVVTRHDNGGIVMHSSLFAAKFGAAGLGNAWYPRSYAGGDVIREGVLGIAANAGLNVAKEFAPELLRLVGVRRRP